MAYTDTKFHHRNSGFIKHLILLIVPGLIFLFIASADLYGQNCKGYDKKCSSAPGGFKSSSLSRSVSMRKMRKVVINQVLYGERTYHFSVCGKNRLGKIHYRVLTADTRSVLYDNAIDNYKTEKLFEIENTLSVVIELTAPHFFDDAGSECAGISISYRKL